MELPERLSGAVWGHLVGDAVGVPYEFGPPVDPESVRFGASGTWGRLPGTWSDDGALMLALLDSLLDAGFDPGDQGRRAVAWDRDGRYTPDGEGRFDIGNATAVALARIEAGAPAETAGATDGRSCGNGSLMRMLPLALVERDIPSDLLVDHAHRASAVTHGHPRAQAACALYVLVARHLLVRPPRLALGSARGRALAEARHELRAIYARDPDADARLGALDHLERWTERAGRSRVWDSFWSAWDAFASADSYRAAIERAVAYGNDADTTAAIAGGLAGIFWGIGGIPAEWLAGMRGRAIVSPLIDRLVATDGWRTSSSHPIGVDWIDPERIPAGAGWTGRLGMTVLPGRRRRGWSGLHWRDVDADAARLRAELGVDTFVLLVEDHELRIARVPSLVQTLRAHGIEVLRFPIRDMHVPLDRGAFAAVLAFVSDRLRAGRRVAVTCRGGRGRTGTVVACLLVDAGLSPEDAIALTRGTRRDTIERGSQVRFVRGWPRR